mgnify:CR=1 FL=1
MNLSLEMQGFQLWGSHNTPGDVIFDADHIRQWAIDSGLVNLEDQLISSDVIEDLSKVFSSEDNLFVVMHVSKNPDGSLDYMEYPGIPVVTLINKSLELEIVYWRCFNSRVEFGFSLNDVPGLDGIEFASEATGKLTVPKFREKLELLKHEGWETKRVQESDREFDVGEELDVTNQDSDRRVRAIFKKSGRAHDVDIQVEAN